MPFIVFVGYAATFICSSNRGKCHQKQTLYIADYPIGTPQGITLVIFGLIAGGALTEAFITFHEATKDSLHNKLENFQIKKPTDWPNFVAVLLVDPDNSLHLLTFFVLSFPFYHGATLGLTTTQRPPRTGGMHPVTGYGRSPVAIFIHAGSPFSYVQRHRQYHHIC